MVFACAFVNYLNTDFTRWILLFADKHLIKVVSNIPGHPEKAKSTPETIDFTASLFLKLKSAENRKKVHNVLGKLYAVEVGKYFSGNDGEIEEWIFENTPSAFKHKISKFQVPSFHRTRSFWMNEIIKAGFNIEQVIEPCPSDKQIKEIPSLESASVVSYFLHVRCRKSESSTQISLAEVAT